MNVRNKLAAVAALSLGAIGAAHAGLPTSAEAVFTDVATDFGTILGYGYVLMGVVTVGMIVLGLVKSVAKKSSK